MKKIIITTVLFLMLLSIPASAKIYSPFVTRTKKCSVSGCDHGFTAFLIDEAEKNSDHGTDCCGPTVAMFLIGIILPVVLTVVFVTH